MQPESGIFLVGEARMRALGMEPLENDVGRYGIPVVAESVDSTRCLAASLPHLVIRHRYR